jgi:hypothetical protein
LPGGESGTLLAFVAEGEAQAGDFDAALTTANAIGAAEVKTFAVRSIATVQVKAGNLEAARRYSETGPNPSPEKLRHYQVTESRQRLPRRLSRRILEPRFKRPPPSRTRSFETREFFPH